MKNAILFFLLISFIVLAAIFKIYVYDSARMSHCINKSREKYPENTGSPSAEQVSYFDDCYKDLGFLETLEIIK